MPPYQPRPGWIAKFSCAFRGLWIGLRGSSFWIHGPLTVAVVATAIWLNIPPAETGVLLLCVGLVWVAEYLNSAVEQLSRAVSRESNESIRDALDLAAGAVLVASLVATILGVWILLPHLLIRLG